MHLPKGRCCSLTIYEIIYSVRNFAQLICSLITWIIFYGVVSKSVQKHHAFANRNTFCRHSLRESRLDEVLTMERNGTTYFYHYDGLGSVTDLTDQSGNIIEHYDYDVYGNITSALSSVGNPYYFTGRRLDDETGIYYYRSRQYDPVIGRFLSRDPLGERDSPLKGTEDK